MIDNRYTAIFRTNNQTVMHWHGEDRETILTNLLFMLECENRSTQVELLDNKTKSIVFSSKKLVA